MAHYGTTVLLMKLILWYMMVLHSEVTKMFTSSADPLGPIVSATEPTTQQDGSSALVTGDIWVSTADLENIRRYTNIIQI